MYNFKGFSVDHEENCCIVFVLCCLIAKCSDLIMIFTKPAMMRVKYFMFFKNFEK